MATEKKRQAARPPSREVQAAEQSMSHNTLGRPQPEGPRHKKPGTTGEGAYYRITVRPKEEFVTFRNEEVGAPGHIQRVGGKRRSGSWDTQAWLISKDDAHIAGGMLLPDTDEARQVLAEIGSLPQHLEGDLFEARPRRNAPQR